MISVLIQLGEAEMARQTATEVDTPPPKKNKPRGRVVSDFTVIIRVQLLQQPRQQQQQQQGHRTDNMRWKFKDNDLDETVCACVCWYAGKQHPDYPEEENGSGVENEA